MDLADLAAYAERKYNIAEQRKWESVLGFSVLADPKSGKWLALLMRRRDSQSGAEMQLCDIKCGSFGAPQSASSFVTAPFRMKGPEWTGVIFAERTDAEIVFQLFDRAVSLGTHADREDYRAFREGETSASPLTALPDNKPGRNKDDAAIVLPGTSALGGGVYRDTVLPFAGRSREKTDGSGGREQRLGLPYEAQPRALPAVSAGSGPSLLGRARTESLPWPVSADGRGGERENDDSPPPAFGRPAVSAQEAALNLGTGGNLRSESGQRGMSLASSDRQFWDFYVPDKITEMIGLYEYGDGSFKQKCRNFYRQGKYMEDYEDDFVGNFPCRQFYPTYHDLDVRQLRCYFAWRSAVRRGEYRPVSLSLAYIYLYELLCGIGAAAPQDAFDRMREFETGFLDAGLGNAGMRHNLRRWMFAFAVMHDLPPELARQYADPALAAVDSSLTVLKTPQAYADDEVVSALTRASDGKLPQSPVIAQGEAKGRHLFAEVWRYLAAHCRADGQDFFTACFGSPRAFERHPLENAVHWEEGGQPDREYALNAIRSYRCRGGRWYEISYGAVLESETFRAFAHETERMLRRHLKIGNALRRKAEESWVTPYVEAVLAAEQRAEAEAARPKISIDFSGLEQIRREAQVTKESLLTAEDLGENAGAGTDSGTSSAGGAEEPKGIQAGSSQPGTRAAETKAFGVGNEINIVSASDEADAAGCVSGAEEPESDRDGVSGASVAESGSSFGPAAAAADCVIKSASALSAAEKEPVGMPAPGNSGIVLDAVHAHILTELLRGRPVDGYIKQHRLMPSLAAETINAAFYDEIGDNVLECEGEALSLVEDYNEDIRKMI